MVPRYSRRRGSPIGRGASGFASRGSGLGALVGSGDLDDVGATLLPEAPHDVLHEEADHQPGEHRGTSGVAKVVEELVGLDVTDITVWQLVIRKRRRGREKLVRQKRTKEERERNQKNQV